MWQCCSIDNQFDINWLLMSRLLYRLRSDCTVKSNWNGKVADKFISVGYQLIKQFPTVKSKLNNRQVVRLLGTSTTEHLSAVRWRQTNILWTKHVPGVFTVPSVAWAVEKKVQICPGWTFEERCPCIKRGSKVQEESTILQESGEYFSPDRFSRN